MNRLTKKTIGSFKYKLRNHVHKLGEFRDYDAFYVYSMAVKRLGEIEDCLIPRPIEEWHEDYGDCLFWKFPIGEPPYCGNPLDSDFIEDYYTHFTRLILPIETSDEKFDEK